MKRRAVIEAAIGETRAAVYEGRRMVELHLDRPWQTTPRTGDIYAGRITSVDEAAKLIASQLRLRGLGGLVVIDFPNLRQPKQRKTLERIFEEACEADPNVTKFNSLSRFGVIEMTRAKPDLSLDDLLNTRSGAPKVETLALRALRRLTREAAVSPGAQLELTVTADIQAWLNDAPFDWRAALTDKIGARFKVSEGKDVNVSADR